MDKSPGVDDLHHLVQGLQRAEAFPHPIGRFEVIETHISLILLTGKFAYKLKKPVNLGFLDFSTAERREYFCHEEVRLNFRLAPEIYLRVVAITDSELGPAIGGEGPALWHAVQMRQFARNRELDILVPRGALQRRHVDALAVDIARFHANCPRSTPDSAFGTPESVAHYVLECFDHAEASVHGEQRKKRLVRLRHWSAASLRSKEVTLLDRKRDGFVREGHGDLHLRNMLLLDDRVVPFDCLEFNAELRWIDVISDIAFLLMDLDYHGQHELAAAFLSGYLEHSGDYGGLGVLRLYQVYRAMVRCKVACIREQQERETGESTAEAEREVSRHLDLAYAYLRRARPRLIITCGFSGSGKSTVAAAILGPLGAIRIRSDVERKRMAGMPLGTEKHDGAAYRGLYAPEMTRRTYRRLLQLADSILENGWSVIVDAAFLLRSERDDFQELAERRAAPFAVLCCRAPTAVLLQRVKQRAQSGGDVSDADAAVLQNQVDFAELPASDESDYVIDVDTRGELDVQAILPRIRSKPGCSRSA